jgi:putative molybdopterin biosynthesis protein
MTDPRLENSVRQERERHGLSQQALAERVGVSRQAIIAIESGRQVPSTVLGLRIARALRTTVEELFKLDADVGFAARLAPMDESAATRAVARVAVGEVAGRWVAHRLPPDASIAADGLLSAGADGSSAIVRPLADPARLRRNVLVAGCAPLIGALTQHLADRGPDASATWLSAGSARALELLAGGFVHVAGIHGGGSVGVGDNASLARRALPGSKSLLVNLARWRLGLVVPAGNPLGIASGADLLRPGLRLARREAGTGAEKLVQALVAAEGARPLLPGPMATGHAEIALLVRSGAADVGVAIESVALAEGLGFVPLVEERFDLVVPAAVAETAPVAQLLDSLGDRAFRADAAELPGYDIELCGHVTTLEAA